MDDSAASSVSGFRGFILGFLVVLFIHFMIEEL
jgi:hypothetical protein